jgi:hypothetical protein
MTDKFTSEDLDALATKLAEVLPDSSTANLEKLAKRAVSIREIVGLIIAIIALVSGGSITYLELKAKPTTQEVEAVVAPVREDVGKLKPRVDRVEKVQDYQIESMAWQGEVLEHIGQETPGKPPKKSEALKRKERELIR